MNSIKMKKMIAVNMFIFILLCLYGQNDSLQHTLKPKVEYYLVYKTTAIQIDSFSIDVFNPKWIKKIEILKYENCRHIYGNMEGKIYIYPKKRFKKKLLENYNKK